MILSAKQGSVRTATCLSKAVPFASHGLLAQAMNVSEKPDAELDMEDEPQEEPKAVEFNLDVCEPYSFHYRGGLPRVFSYQLLTDSWIWLD